MKRLLIPLLGLIGWGAVATDVTLSNIPAASVAPVGANKILGTSTSGTAKLYSFDQLWTAPLLIQVTNTPKAQAHFLAADTNGTTQVYAGWIQGTSPGTEQGFAGDIEWFFGVKEATGNIELLFDNNNADLPAIYCPWNVGDMFFSAPAQDGAAFRFTNRTSVTQPDAIFSGVIRGNASGVTNIPVAGLSASGTPNSFTYYRGDNTWATPGTNQTAIPNTITFTNWVQNTIYTNKTGTVIHARVPYGIVTAGVNGLAQFDVMCDPNGGTTYQIIGGNHIQTTLAVTLVSSNSLWATAIISNNATFYMTNTSTGANNSSSCLTGGYYETEGDNTAVSVASTATTNYFSANQGIGGNLSVGGQLNGNAAGLTNLLVTVIKLSAWVATNSSGVAIISGPLIVTNGGIIYITNEVDMTNLNATALIQFTNTFAQDDKGFEVVCSNCLAGVSFVTNNTRFSYGGQPPFTGVIDLLSVSKMGFGPSTNVVISALPSLLP